jgi:hypothetical protein
MKKFNEFLDKHYRKIFLIFLVVIFVQNCGNPNKGTNKRVDELNAKVDSLQNQLNTDLKDINKRMITPNDLKIEGLKSELRMIESTDRRMMDKNRQTAIRKEIEELEK